MKNRIKRIWKIILNEFALLTAEFLAVLLLGFLAVNFFLWMSTYLETDHIVMFDNSVTGWVRNFESQAMDVFMHGVTFMGNAEFVVFPALGIILYFLFIKPHRWFFIKVPVVSLGSLFANLILKDWYDRPRPMMNQMVEVGGLSFPSGHAMVSMAFYGLIIYIIWHYIKGTALRWTLTILFSLVILFIGTSRVYLGVHFPSDVAAGFVAGFAWLLASIVFLNYLEDFLERMSMRKVKKSV